MVGLASRIFLDLTAEYNLKKIGEEEKNHIDNEINESYSKEDTENYNDVNQLDLIG